MEWQTVIINRSLILAETEKALLIKEPKGDYRLWISKKCLKQGNSFMTFQAGFNSAWEYKLFKQGPNKEVLDEKTVTGNEAILRFTGNPNN